MMRTTCADKCVSQDTVITSQNWEEIKNKMLKVGKRFVPLRLAWTHHHVFYNGGHPRSIVMGVVTIRTVKATLDIISVVKDHP